MRQRKEDSRRRQPRGFTLLEVGIAVGIAGLLLAIAVPSLNAVTAAELKETTGMFQGLMRDTYARAALSGKAHRVVFDLDQRSYWVEASEGGVVMPRTRIEPNREGVIILDPVDERVAGLLESTDEEDRARVQLYSNPTWNRVPFPGRRQLDELQPQRMPSDVRIARIWVDHLAAPATGGQVALHFFPGGYTQEAFVTLTDNEEEEGALTLVTQPLTGEIWVQDKEPEVRAEDDE